MTSRQDQRILASQPPTRAAAELMEQGAEQAAALLRSLANKHRLMILCALAEGECSVGELVARLAIRQPNASQHLARLKAEGLVAARRDGTTIHYRLASPEVTPIIEQLHASFCRMQDD
jgi:DNA-binding transcriptional ArsR family regulator